MTGNTNIEEDIENKLSAAPTAEELYQSPELKESTYTPGTYTPTEATAPSVTVPKAETPNYSVNYNDERFQKVEAEKQGALTDINNAYSGMINSSDKFYEDQINASKEWAEKQSQLQQQRTDLTIEQLKQQEEQARKDYTKEQSGAYTDYKKQSSRFGAEAESQAAGGMLGTGFSESSQVAMYNTYQNRVATAREVLNKSVLNFENGMKEAMLQCDSALAEIYFNAHKEQLELALQGFQYKNNLLLEQTNKKLEVDQMYYQRWQNVLSQINSENALAEQIRQYNLNRELEVQKFQESTRQWYLNYNEQVKQFNASYQQGVAEFEERIRQYDNDIAMQLSSNTADAKATAAQLQAEREEAILAHEEWVEEMKLEREKLAEERAQREAESGELKIEKDDEGGGSEPVIDYESLSAIGYDDLTAEEALAKVDSGELVLAPRDDGSYYFAKNPNYKAPQAGGNKDPENKDTDPEHKLSDTTADMDTLKALGLENATSEELAHLVKIGMLKVTFKNGKYYFIKNPDYKIPDLLSGTQRSMKQFATEAAINEILRQQDK